MISILSSDSPFFGAFVIKTVSFVEILICVLVFSRPFKHRDHLLSRLGLTALLSLVMLGGIIYSYSTYDNVWVKIAINYSIYVFLYFCLQFLFKMSFTERALCICAGIATQIVVGKTYEFVLLWSGNDPYNSISFVSENTIAFSNWLVYVVCHLTLIFLLGHFFNINEKDTFKAGKITLIFSLAITFITIPLITYSRLYEAENPRLASVIRIFSICYGLLVLIFRSGIIEHQDTVNRLEIYNDLVTYEKQQYQALQSDIELINMKYHDLKYHISDLDQSLAKTEYVQLKKAIDAFDSKVKTGNDVIDMILYKKINYGHHHQIQISTMINGRLFSFMKVAHQFALFSNAIDNAIEAVIQISEIDKRIISLTSTEEDDHFTLHVSNFYVSPPQHVDHQLLSSKQDRANHGYGIKSMQYICSLYQGHLSFDYDDRLFFLHITFPRQ